MKLEAQIWLHLSSGDNPPCMQKILLLIIAAKGMQLKLLTKAFHTYTAIAFQLYIRIQT